MLPTSFNKDAALQRARALGANFLIQVEVVDFELLDPDDKNDQAQAGLSTTTDSAATVEADEQVEL